MTRCQKGTKKLIISIVVVLLFGVLVLCGIMAYKGCKENEYDRNYKKELRKSSVEELEKHLAVCDEVLAMLDSTINADETDPESRFEARTARKEIEKNRALVQTELNKRKEN